MFLYYQNPLKESNLALREHVRICQYFLKAENERQLDIDSSHVPLVWQKMLKIVENMVLGLKGGLSVSRLNYWELHEKKVLICEAIQLLANAALSQLS